MYCIALTSRDRIGTMDRRLAKKEAFAWLMAKTFVRQPCSGFAAKKDGP